MSTSPAAYGLEYQARSIAAFYQPNPPVGVHRFLVGTANPAGGNKLYLLDYHEHNRTADCTAVWSHPEEIWDISVSPCTTNARGLFATYSPGEDTCRMHGVAEAAPTGDVKDLERLGIFPVGTRQVLWDTEGLQTEVRTVSVNELAVWKTEPFLTDNKTSATSNPQQRVVFPKPLSTIQRAANDPHHASVVAIASREGIHIVDTREKKVVATAAEHPHAPGALRWIDFSPSTMHKLLTTGEDGSVHLWDVRNLSRGPSGSGDAGALSTTPPIRRAHQHYCLGAAFHPIHDQLILSWGSDHTCKLWDTNHHSESSASAKSASTTHRPEKSITEFGESVHCAAWSSSGAWTFAAVAFHGKVLVDTVPNDTKMRTLTAVQPSEDF